MPAEKIHEWIQAQQKRVANVPNVGQPLVILHDRVGLMSVHDEDPPAIGGDMDRVLHNADAAVLAEKVADELVVIARDVNQLCAFAALAQNFLG